MWLLFRSPHTATKTTNSLINSTRLQDYDFHPQSFVLPHDKDKLLHYASSFASDASKARRAKSSSASAAPSATAPGGSCWYAPGSQPQPSASAQDRLTFICKPDTGSRGNGIYLALGVDDIEELQAPNAGDAPWATGEDGEDDEKTMVQAYLPRPLLMDGRKFDLRIYIMMTSAYPTLRLFIYRQGLTRFATEDYQPPSEANVAQRRMFLTNYAVNRPDAASGGASDDPAYVAAHSKSGGSGSVGKGIVSGDDSGGEPPLPPLEVQQALLHNRQGCKWTMDEIFTCLGEQGVDTVLLWERVKDVVTKAILAIRPQLAQRYRAARPQLRRQPPPPCAVPVPLPSTVAKRIPVPLKPPRPLQPRRAVSARQQQAAAGANGERSATDSSDASGSIRRIHSATAMPHLKLDPALDSSFAAATSPFPLSPQPPLTSPFAAARASTSGVRPLLSQQAISAGFSSSSSQVVQSATLCGSALGGLSIAGSGVKLSVAQPPPARLLPPPTDIPPSPAVAAQSSPAAAAAPVPRRSLSGGIAETGANSSSSRNSDSGADMPAEGKPNLPPASPSHKAAAASLSSARKQGAKPSRGANNSSTNNSSSAPRDGEGDELEDGEQGFRCFEFMGLDIILDMSHCACERRQEYQHVCSRPQGPWPPGKHRCQPRPVLLEINQSPSMHSDADVDRIVKGDAIMDALALAAPDEQYLLAQFLASMRLDSEGKVSTSPSGASTTAPQPAAENDFSGRVSLSDIPSAAALHAEHQYAALEEATALMALYGASTTSPSSYSPSALAIESERIGTPGVSSASVDAEVSASNPSSVCSSSDGSADSVSDCAEDGPSPSRSVAEARPRDASFKAAVALPSVAPKQPLAHGGSGSRLPPVPWVPLPPSKLPEALDSVWREERWFGLHSSNSTTDSAASGGRPSQQWRPSGASSALFSSSSTQPSTTTIMGSSGGGPSLYSLNTLPPLSSRAGLVLALRRIYEHLHMGGYQQLLPPPSPELVYRYRRIAEFVPPNLRETPAFLRRRNEALAMRAAIEEKLRVPSRF